MVACGFFCTDAPQPGSVNIVLLQDHLGPAGEDGRDWFFPRALIAIASCSEHPLPIASHAHSLQARTCTELDLSSLSIYVKDQNSFLPLLSVLLKCHRRSKSGRVHVNPPDIVTVNKTEFFTRTGMRRRLCNLLTESLLLQRCYFL